MKRLIAAVVSTIAGLVALFSFTTHPRHIAASQLSASSPPTTDPSRSAAPAGPPPKTTVGKAYRTAYGIVQVQIVTVGKHIDAVSFAQLTARDPLAERINRYAAPILLKETLEVQSSHIDAVSGASYTSQGYRDSLQSAIDRSRE